MGVNMPIFNIVGDIGANMLPKNANGTNAVAAIDTAVGERNAYATAEP